MQTSTHIRPVPTSETTCHAALIDIQQPSTASLQHAATQLYATVDTTSLHFFANALSMAMLSPAAILSRGLFTRGLWGEGERRGVDNRRPGKETRHRAVKTRREGEEAQSSSSHFATAPTAHSRVREQRLKQVAVSGNVGGGLLTIQTPIPHCRMRHLAQCETVVLPLLWSTCIQQEHTNRVFPSCQGKKTYKPPTAINN